MMTHIPGGSAHWTDVLPDEYHNAEIVVVTVKRGAMTRVRTTSDGWHIGLLETRHGEKGLQILNAAGDYREHFDIIERRYGTPMADPSFIGNINDLSDEVLLNDLMPLVFLGERMGQSFLNLKNYLYNISIGDADDKRHD